MLAEIIGPDILILIAVIALLFGGSQIPKLARSVGRAQHEFKKGLEEGNRDEPAPPEVPPTAPTAPTDAVTPPPTTVERPPGSTN
ncbi:MAG: twin arginine-targeting protein translocase, TatA/E family [Actinomycetia bacterium]|nr:twin arginine-targeting protein translocase, TatA/E family [Actinomycetes bacterium]